MVVEDGAYSIAPTVWRISGDGRGVEVHAYHEDSGWVTDAVNRRRSRRWVPGERLTPSIQETRAYQFVAFVRAFGRHFNGVDRVDLAADYRGLSGRTIDDPRPGYGRIWGMRREAAYPR